MSLRTGHLFAGAGGGLYADLILGHEPVFAVEWDTHAATALQHRANDGWFPGLHVHHGDVRLFDTSIYKGRVDSLHAGFPCQDISVAGNGAGIEGERSGLWAEVIRIAGELQPGELFLENSPAITSRGLGTVLGDLAELGYDARWCVLPASAVGAPHIRARWWCLARRTNSHRLWELQPEGGQQDIGRRSGDLRQAMADTDPERRNGRTGPPGKTRRAKPAHSSHLANADSLSIQGLKPCSADSQKREKQRERPAGPQGNGHEWWATEPRLGRVANGVAHRGNRIKCLGNGQVPLQAAAAYMLLDTGMSRTNQH